ncbi:unnamed protein product [Soboliphyme baturini]|uniref:Mitochondrial carrier protein n=1 Tax=Soboliphyme baturini TaxID=241478 RepID=A0A183IR81_9BILA|nr:unnamed protein product [Soboliphyme baturini]
MDNSRSEELSEHQRTNSLRNFIAGGVGGVFCVLSGHPFDTIKVRVQTATHTPLGDIAVFKGTYDCLRKTVVNEGFFALYKGMAAPLTGVAPLFALYFFGCSVGKRLQQTDPDQIMTPFQNFNAGAFAGVLTTTVMAPGERIKCLLQVQHSKHTAKYSGPIDVVKQLYKEGGLKSIFRGTAVTLLRGMSLLIFLKRKASMTRSRYTFA